MKDLPVLCESSSRQERRQGGVPKDDNDIGQAIVRTIISSLVFAYVLYVWSGNTSLIISTQAMSMSLAYSIFSISILISNLFWPGEKTWRRIISIMADSWIVTYILIVGGEAGTPIVGGYLWTTIANGLRFGRKLLYTANVFSALGMIAVLILSDYWREQIILGIGLLIWLIILPAYVVKLIKKLEAALNTAEQASRTKSIFLANMSHELRTPLNVIIGYSEILEEDAFAAGNQQAVKDLNKVQGSANHLLHLINEILDLSKIEAGKMDLHYELLELSPLIEEVMSTIQPVIKMNNNTLEFNIDNDIGPVYADMTKLRQILYNLLGNAGKFTHDGTVSLSVTRTSGDATNEIIFSIKDTGIGMNEEQLNRLFAPFVQADDSTTRKYGGTGLGLVISKRFCEMMNGSIAVTSKADTGSVFTIRLPILAQQQVASNTEKTT
jgi:signal transduction histidine kinase